MAVLNVIKSQSTFEVFLHPGGNFQTKKGIHTG